MARDKIGSFMEADDVESWLNRWINNYVNGMPDAGQEMRAKYPLREARVDVREVPGAPGSYEAVAYLRPWLQMEELTTSSRTHALVVWVNPVPWIAEAREGGDNWSGFAGERRMIANAIAEAEIDNLFVE